VAAPEQRVAQGLGVRDGPDGCRTQTAAQRARQADNDLDGRELGCKIRNPVQVGTAARHRLDRGGDKAVGVAACHADPNIAYVDSETDSASKPLSAVG